MHARQGPDAMKKLVVDVAQAWPFIATLPGIDSKQEYPVGIESKVFVLKIHECAHE